MDLFCVNQHRRFNTVRSLRNSPYAARRISFLSVVPFFLGAVSSETRKDAETRSLAGRIVRSGRSPTAATNSVAVTAEEYRPRSEAVYSHNTRREPGFCAGSYVARKVEQRGDQTGRPTETERLSAALLGGRRALLRHSPPCPTADACPPNRNSFESSAFSAQLFLSVGRCSPRYNGRIVSSSSASPLHSVRLSLAVPGGTSVEGDEAVRRGLSGRWESPAAFCTNGRSRGEFDAERSECKQTESLARPGRLLVQKSVAESPALQRVGGASSTDGEIN